MGVGQSKKIPVGDPEKKTTSDERGEDANQGLRGLEEKRWWTQNMEELPREMIENAQQYSHLLHAQLENTQELTQLLHEPIGYPEGRQVIHDPTGYAEGMRSIQAEEEESEDQEGEEQEKIRQWGNDI